MKVELSHIRGKESMLTKRHTAHIRKLKRGREIRAYGCESVYLRTSTHCNKYISQQEDPKLHRWRHSNVSEHFNLQNPKNHDK